MTTRKRSHHFGRLLRLVELWFTGMLIIASVTPRWALAQSTDDPWAIPLNLSHSGASTNPSIVIDSDAVVHVVWQDEFANFVYSKFDDGQWSAPQRTSLHQLFGSPAFQDDTDQTRESLSTGPNPLFVAGHSRNILAFWITSQGSLRASRVNNRDFMNLADWRDRVVLSSSAASFAAAVDLQGVIHVAYLRTDEGNENPAGIYYTRSTNNGLRWSTPKLLYQSPYFRGLDGSDANLNLATAGTTDSSLVYIAWDNQPRKRVFLVKSTDGGANWEEPIQMAGPKPETGLTSPFNILVGASGNSAVLIWQNGSPGGTCTQLFRFSVDAGSTWSEEQLMTGNQPGCAKANKFVTDPAANPGGALYLLTDIHGEILLSAWNGLQWSESQRQTILSGFVEPETYTQVVYDCHNAALSGELLYFIGCDRGGGGDIWITSRDLKSTSFWFSPPLWSQPAPVSRENLEVSAVELVAAEDGLIHVFISRLQDTAIYHSRWDGASWSRIAPVLQLQDEEAGLPVVAAGPGNELFLMTRSSKGSLYFSRANSSDALTASRWSSPTRLQIDHDGKVGSADVAWDATGKIYIAYSVPVNDERGIYLVKTNDNGQTWSAPLQVFDGAQADFDFVGSPSLVASVNGYLHIIWTRQSLQADGVSQPIAIYYARSEDSGQSFGEAERVVDAPVTWRKIVSEGKGNAHLIWQQPDMMNTLWDQVFSESENLWQEAALLPTEGGAAAVTVDAIGRFHLLGVDPESLSHWLWDGNRWQKEAPYHWSLALQDGVPERMLAATVNKDGKMVVVLAMPTEQGVSLLRSLLYTVRALDLSPGQTMIQQTLTESSPSLTNIQTTPTAELSLAPALTVDSDSASLQSPTDRSEAGSPIDNLARFLLFAALILLGVLSILALRIARARPR